MSKSGNKNIKLYHLRSPPQISNILRRSLQIRLLTIQGRCILVIKKTVYSVQFLKNITWLNSGIAHKMSATSYLLGFLRVPYWGPGLDSHMGTSLCSIATTMPNSSRSSYKYNPTKWVSLEEGLEETCLHNASPSRRYVSTCSTTPFFLILRHTNNSFKYCHFWLF